MRLSYDRLDDVNFPRHGTAVRSSGAGERAGLGSDQTADRLAFDWITARTFGRQTAVLWTSFGTALERPRRRTCARCFRSAGSSISPACKADSLTGPHFGIARLLLYRQIGRGGPGFLDVPAYIGLSLEAGNVWQRRSDASFGSTRKDASLFLGFDTLLGPVYLATGFEERGTQAFYLFLGRTF